MSDQLVLVFAPQPVSADLPADGAAVWPRTADGATAWAERLHDRLVAEPQLDDIGAVDRIASWLRVQAIGRSRIEVSEPRLDVFAPLWAAAAHAAGVADVRLAPTRADDGEPVAADPPRRPAVPVRSDPVGSAGRARLWALDRAEQTARVVVRALQR
jgi:hypothetical protein